MKPFSLAYQITQECPFKCSICLRYYQSGEKCLTAEQRKQMVDILYQKGLRKLTVTGGEPTILGSELFDFLKYVHQKQIHVCLSTTGYLLSKQQINEMNEYVDQLLISIRSLNQAEWVGDFGNRQQSEELFETVLGVVDWVKTTQIRLEVDTVLHKHNLKSVIDLGWKLAQLNPNIFWRIEEYYGIGKESKRRSEFELELGEFERAATLIQNTFGQVLPHIRFRSNKTRASAPDFFISQSGYLITTSNYQALKTPFGFVNNTLPPTFLNSRPWSEYAELFRDWGWIEEIDL